MPPFAESTSTSSAVTGTTIYYSPNTTTYSTASETISTSPIYTTISGPTLSFSVTNIKEEVTEYCDKVDQHVDKLEEDIEFLNNKRHLNEEHIERLINQNIQKDTKIKELEDAVTFLKGYTTHLEILIHELEEKINE